MDKGGWRRSRREADAFMQIWLRTLFSEMSNHLTEIDRAYSPSISILHVFRFLEKRTELYSILSRPSIIYCISYCDDIAVRIVVLCCTVLLYNMIIIFKRHFQKTSLTFSFPNCLQVENRILHSLKQKFDVK